MNNIKTYNNIKISILKTQVQGTMCNSQQNKKGERLREQKCNTLVNIAPAFQKKKKQCLGQIPKISFD